MSLAFPKPEKRAAKPRKRLERKARLRARGRTAHARRPRDFAFMAEVAKLPCAAKQLEGRSDCDGRVEVDHAFGRRGKDSDRRTIPLCSKHHREKTGVVGGGGFMAGWARVTRQVWLEVAIARTQAEVARRRPLNGEGRSG